MNSVVKRKSVWFCGFAAAVALAAGAAWFALKPHASTGKPNVLVVSLCSLRQQDLSAAPGLERFLSQSHYVFDNAFNGLPWVGLFSFVRQSVPENFFAKAGYELIGMFERHQMVRVPYYRFPRDEREDWKRYLAGKDYKETEAYLRQLILTPRRNPFYLVAHYQYLHFPLIDRFNRESQWDFFLSESEKTRLQDLLATPGKHPDKLPFLLMLRQDEEFIAKLPLVRSVKNLGLMTNPELLKRWRDSAGYGGDLEILHKIYRANLRHLDRVLQGILNLYGDPELQRNTILVLAGDHGEMQMERGQLTHSTSVYDEALRIPLAIRFPGGGTPVHIETQTDLTRLPALLQGMMEGSITAENLSEAVARTQGDVLLARDCNGQVRGLRQKNKYKYFVNISDGSRHLFDLETDPGERRDLASERIDLTDKLEETYWAEFKRFSGWETYKCSSFAE